MGDELSVFAALLGAVVGGIIGFASAFLIQRQIFQRQDGEKLYEKVYGAIWPILEKAKMRYQYDDAENQWPGKYWLSAPEVLKIERILATHSNLIPAQVQTLWIDARHKGPHIEGIGEVESDNVFSPYALEKLHQKISLLMKKRNSH